GRTVNFTNTLLIMTSNVGSELVLSAAQGALRFAPEDERDTERPWRERPMRRLRDTFRPAVLDRADALLVCHTPPEEQLEQITTLRLEDTKRKAHAQGVNVEFAAEGVRWLSEAGYQPEYGARPLRRTSQREVDNVLSRMLLEGEVGTGADVNVTVRDGRLAFDVAAPAAPIGH